MKIIILIAVCFLCSSPVFAGAIITNGTVSIGVNDTGSLVFSGTGIQFIPTGNESLTPGCACEGWGVADATTVRFGRSGQSFGTQNVVIESFTSTANSATSVVKVADGAGDLVRITHAFAPSTTPNLFEVKVTIENISGAGINDLRYRRVMDWDIEPTAFSEMVTIMTGGAANVLFSSDNGFANGNPLAGNTSRLFTGEATDSGPADHGALFDFGFGSLPNGARREFTMYYGATVNDTAALAALSSVSANQVYSLGKPDPANNAVSADGSPNTFIWGFKDLDKPPILPARPAPANIPIFSPLGVIVLLTGLMWSGRRRITKPRSTR